MFKPISFRLFSFKFFRRNSSSITSFLTQNSSKPKLTSSFVEKIQSLPIKINTNHLDLATLDRMNLCSNEFLAELLLSLDTYGIRDTHLTNTLKSHDDWSVLTRERLSLVFQMFRDLSFTSDVYIELITRNPKLISIEQRSIETRLNEFKLFFTNKQVDRLLVRTPDLLTCNFDSFDYKFNYLFTLMGASQDEQSRTNVYCHSLEHIRCRHLFLVRAGFFDKPNKKGISKVTNPKLKEIMDTNLKEYLRICTNSLFDSKQFDTFCDYLSRENVEDELLGNRVGRSLQNKIISNVKQSKYEENTD